MSRFVLITGATAGIGFHAAEYFLQRGDVVIATGRRIDRIESLKGKYPSLHAVAMDVTSQESVDAAIPVVQEITGGHGVDVLINNAGFGLAGPLIEIEQGDFEYQFAVNVFGLHRTTLAFGRPMIARGRGRIINVGSIAGRVPGPFTGAYYATKHAVEAMSDALRFELGYHGIQVALIEPGPIASEFTDVIVGTLKPSPHFGDLPNLARNRIQKKVYHFSPEWTSQAIYHAATSPRPRHRYVVPWFLTVPVILNQFLPSWVFDSVGRTLLPLHRIRALGGGKRDEHQN